jgi:hypothetical protein
MELRLRRRQPEDITRSRLEHPGPEGRRSHGATISRGRRLFYPVEGVLFDEKGLRE